MSDDIELTSDEEGAPAGNKKKKLIIIGAAAVVLLIVIGVAVAMLMGGDESPEAVEGEEVVENEEPEWQLASYYNMEKPFIVRFENRDRFSLLRIKLALMTRDGEVLKAFKTHESMMRHKFVDIMATSNAGALLTRDGKRAMQKQLVVEANQVVKELGELDKKQQVENILITEFVMQ